MDIVTQRNLVTQAAINDPRDALSLCQIDNRYRYVCGQLPNETKFKVCLDNNDNAKECDKVPVFSKQQFLRLIPPQIEIFPEEPLQLRHEFYSQNYKLKTEGFSESLRKAKVINTLVALSRPDVLLKYADQLLPLPAYIDAGQIDQLLSFYREIVSDFVKNPTDSNFNITITAQSSSMPEIEVSIDFWLWWRPDAFQFILEIQSNIFNSQKLGTINDKYVNRHFRAGQYQGAAGDVDIVYKNLDGSNDAPNPFIFSRIIYDLLNKGFDIWKIQYGYQEKSSPTIEI